MSEVWKKETLSFAGQTFYGLMKQEAEKRRLKPGEVRPYGVRGRVAEGMVSVEDHRLLLASGETLLWEGFREWKEYQIRQVCLFVLCVQQNIPDSCLEHLDLQYKEETCAGIALSLARKLLRERYEAQWKREGMTASVVLGPGYYGMDVKMAERILKTTGAADIGVTYDRGMLHPVFSLAGLFLKVPDEKKKLENPCRYCQGTADGCLWCEMRNEKEW
ncbi:MAG: hypothetical protein PUB10_08905 [Clostridiales bacterium]|nr:hypothetical protein [Clostridiales bacterium]